MITREMTCIVCPKGCRLTVGLEGKKVLSVEGNECKRGITYAITECTAPMRTVTTTAATMTGGVLPVKTSKPIPKELMFDCIREINKLKVSPDTKNGDVLIKNIFGTGADIVATRDGEG